MQHGGVDVLAGGRDTDEHGSFVSQFPGRGTCAEMFCHAHHFETIQQLDWDKLLSRLTEVAARTYSEQQQRPGVPLQLQPSPQDPTISNVTCKQSVARGDVLGFLIGRHMEHLKALGSITACNSSQEALELANKMHTFSTTLVPQGEAQLSNVSAKEQPQQPLPSAVTLIVDKEDESNLLAHIAETAEAPNTAVVMVSSRPDCTFSFPVVAVRDIEAGEVLTFRRAEKAEELVFRASKHAHEAAQPETVAAAGAEQPPQQAPSVPAPTAAEPPSEDDQCLTMKETIVSECFEAAWQGVQELHYMLETAAEAVSAYYAKPQQQNEGGPLEQCLPKVDSLMKQALALLSCAQHAADQQAAAAKHSAVPPAAAQARVRYPETPDVETPEGDPVFVGAAGVPALPAGQQLGVDATAVARVPTAVASEAAGSGLLYASASGLDAPERGAAAPTLSADAAQTQRQQQQDSRADSAGAAAAAAGGPAACANAPRSRRRPARYAEDEPDDDAGAAPGSAALAGNSRPQKRAAGETATAADNARGTSNASAEVSQQQLLQKRPRRADILIAPDAAAAADSVQPQSSKRPRRLTSEQPTSREGTPAEGPGSHRRASGRQQQTKEPWSPTGVSGSGGGAKRVGAGSGGGNASAAFRQIPAEDAAAVQEHIKQLKASLACSSKPAEQQQMEPQQQQQQQAPAAQPPAAADAIAAARQLRLLAQQGPKHQKAVITAGAIPLLLQLLHSTEPAAQLEAAAGLALFGQEEKCCVAMSKAIPHFVELLGLEAAGDATAEATDAAAATAHQIVQNVAAVLYNMLEHTAAATAIAAQNGVNRLLQLLHKILTDLDSSGSSGSRTCSWDIGSSSTSRLDLLDPVLGSLRHMAYPESEDTTRAIAAADGISMFMHAVIGSTAAIMHLAEQQQTPQRNRGSSGSPGGAPAAASDAAARAAVKQKLQRIQEHALGALWNVARLKDLHPGILAAAAAAGGTASLGATKHLGYKMIVQSVKSKSPKVQYEACGVLQWLAEAGTVEVKGIIAAAGAVEPLIAILAAGNSRTDDEMELKGNAAGALSQLANNSRSNQGLIISAGAIPHVINMLDNSEKVVSASMETMQKEAARLLQAIAVYSNTVKDSIMKGGGVQQLVQLLSNSRNSDVVTVAVAALAEVVKGRPANQQAAADAGVVQVLKGLLKNSSKGVSAVVKSLLDVFK